MVTTEADRTVGEAEDAKAAMREAVEEYCRARHNLWFAQEKMEELREAYGDDEASLENEIDRLHTHYEENELDQEVEAEMESLGAWVREQTSATSAEPT